MSGPPLDPARAPRAQRPGLPIARAPGQRGAVSWVTLLLLAAAILAGYLGFVWVPVYSENYAAKQVVHDFMNQAVKNRDDALLRRNMVAKLRSLAEVEGLDEYGQRALVPAISVEEQDVLWERDADSKPPMLRVSFEYTREVQLPLLERTAFKVFTVDLSNDLTMPDWGPSR